MFTKRTNAESYVVESAPRQAQIAEELRRVGKQSVAETTPQERRKVLDTGTDLHE